MISKRNHQVVAFGFVALLLLGSVVFRNRGDLGSWGSNAVSNGSGLKGRVLLSGNQVAAPEKAESVFRGARNSGAPLAPLSREETGSAKITDTDSEGGLDQSNEDDKALLKSDSREGISHPAAAPSQSRVDTSAPVPASATVIESKDGVKRHTSLAATQGPASEDVEEVDTKWNKSLTDARNADASVKLDEGFETNPSLTNGTSNNAAGGSDEGVIAEGGDWDDDEGGSVTSEIDPPKLEHRTSSWEGFGDPSKKLTLTVVCSNTGGGVLEVKIATPTWIRADPESVRVGAGEERNITITVLDPKGLKGPSARIQIRSNGGDEFFEITRAALGRTDWKDALPSTSLSSTAMGAVGSTVVGLVALAWYLCRRRNQRHGASSFKYKELEMQGDLSSALGQLPAGAGMAMNSYSSGYGPSKSPRAMTDEESTQGWDDNWDDWDQEEQRSRR